jgi:hypothetical protein
MKEVEQYRNRVREAATLDEKKAIAAELHRLADTFNESQREEYRLAMHSIDEEIVAKLEAIAPYAQQAEELISRIKSRVPQP